MQHRWKGFKEEIVGEKKTMDQPQTGDDDNAGN